MYCRRKFAASGVVDQDRRVACQHVVGVDVRDGEVVHPVVLREWSTASTCTQAPDEVSSHWPDWSWPASNQAFSSGTQNGWLAVAVMTPAALPFSPSMSTVISTKSFRPSAVDRCYYPVSDHDVLDGFSAAVRHQDGVSAVKLFLHELNRLRLAVASSEVRLLRPPPPPTPGPEPSDIPTRTIRRRKWLRFHLVHLDPRFLAWPHPAALRNE